MARQWQFKFQHNNTGEKLVLIRLVINLFGGRINWKLSKLNIFAITRDFCAWLLSVCLSEERMLSPALNEAILPHCHRIPWQFGSFEPHLRMNKWISDKVVDWRMFPSDRSLDHHPLGVIIDCFIMFPDRENKKRFVTIRDSSSSWDSTF